MMFRMWRAAFWPSWEMYSPLTTNPRATVPNRIHWFRMVTPVSIPAHAFATSKVIAPSAPIARATALLIVGSSHWVRPPRNLVMLQLITTSIDAVSRCALARQSSAAEVARL
jgi:hypothetical protein